MVLPKKEGVLIDKELNILSQESVNLVSNKFSDDKLIISNDEASSWTIYSQILGLDKYQESKFSGRRSLSSIFSKNILMPFKASSCFPSSQMVNSILRGEMGDNESFRKMIIFLVFYSF